MRVTNNMMLRNTTSNINNNKYSVNSLNNQMSSQKKISRPSEDPVVAIRALRLRSNLSEINQYYEKNIPDADAWLDVTETALKNMKTILSDIRTQCTYGASDQLKAEDRKTILTQLESLRKQIYSEGNSDYAGRTVFTGYRTNCKLTFMEDESNTEYNIQQKFSYEDIGEHRYYDGQVELKTAEEMSQKVTTSDTKQYTYDRIRLAYGNIGSLKDKDGNEIAVGNTGTLSYHYTDNTGAAKTGDLNVTVYETEDDWKKAVKAGNMPKDGAALILARGDRKATYKDIVGLTSDEYNRSTADSIATGMSVMLQAQAQLDQLVHGMITAINDTLCPNTTLGELTGNTASLTGTDENGNTVTITSGMKVLDTKNCSTGSDKQIPPQELFTRLGTERYTKVSVQETDANGNTVTNDYYVYNEESETDTSKQYTLASVSVNDKLVEQESLLPHLSQNGEVNYDLAQKVAALWNGEYLTLDPDDTNKVTFIDYYNNMVGAFGTIGSVYESTSTSLSGTVTAVDNQRSQVMGVSSDEELTKMIKFQNAYNASSRFINVVNEMIESMITQLGS